MKHDLYNETCILSVAHGLRKIGRVNRNIPGTKQLLDDQGMFYMSNRGTWDHTVFSKNPKFVKYYVDAMMTLNVADVGNDAIIDGLIDNAKAREIIKAAKNRRTLVRDYFQGVIFEYPECCVLSFIDESKRLVTGSDYVPWYQCSKGCKKTAEYEKEMKKIMEENRTKVII